MHSMRECKYIRYQNIKKKYLSPLGLEKLKATLTVYIFFPHCRKTLSDRDGEAGSCTFPHCFAGVFSICGRTPQAARDIWFIHNGVLSQEL